MQERNRVELLEVGGSDEVIACAAWVSTTTELTEERRSRIPSLIDMLMRHQHWSPFENGGWLRFRLLVDNATHIQLLRHRHQSINVESARYKEYRQDRYHLPLDWPEEYQALLAEHAEHSFALYHQMIQQLESSGISRKRAKESARYYLPMNLQLECMVSMNLRAFFHFLSLRNSEDAQLEIRQLAQEMLAQVRDTGRFKYALASFEGV